MAISGLVYLVETLPRKAMNTEGTGDAEDTGDTFSETIIPAGGESPLSQTLQTTVLAQLDLERYCDIRNR
jgi:hypothetical protein